MAEAGRSLAGIMTLGQCWQVSGSWYEGRLELDYRRPSPDVFQSLLRGAGLIGEAWSLTAPEILLVPGLWNSGPEHWQSYWERGRADCRRVVQTDWETPRRSDWVTALEAAVAASPDPVVLAAHSLGCALVAHWAGVSRHLAKVRGALLVAPSDVEAPSYPTGTSGFVPMPLVKLPFPAIVVMSTDDEYVTPARAARFANAWGARLVDVGAKGHINSASHLGNWPDGFALIEELRAAR